jgi:hypothetical protein
VAVITRILSGRFPISVAILLLGPLLGLATGYTVQSCDNRTKAREREFYAEQEKAYARYSMQVIADPGIVLRERWFERESKFPWSASMSARKMVFEDSFQPDHFSVSYTGDQLREIFNQAPEMRGLVVRHPMCPADLRQGLRQD